jgi:hypothetical protein
MTKYKEYIFSETKRHTKGWRSWVRFNCVCKGKNISKKTKNVVHPDDCFISEDSYSPRKPTKKELCIFTLQFLKLKISSIIDMYKKNKTLYIKNK